MAILVSSSRVLLPILPLFLAFNLANSEPFIGVNYGQVADNLPPPSATAKLLQSTAIGKVRLYGTDPAIIKALANTGIGIVIGAANGDIPALASDPNFAKTWVSSNVAPYYPASNIILITVGNEVITSNDTGLVNQMLPAIQNVQNALDAASFGGGKIKVSTVHSMAVLGNSEPPSGGKFHAEYDTVLQGLLSFNNATGSPFAINPYPYFAYKSDPGRPDNLAFCLFQPNSGRVDPNTNLNYMNMFDAQVDAVRSALDSLGFKNVEIVVAETGWPYKGDNDEVGPSLENAKAYNGNLIAHLRSKVGTPLMPGKSVDTYLFALYDEDLKPGPASERAFGLYNPDQSMIYDAGLSKQQQQSSSPSPVVAPTTPDVSKSPVNPTPRVSSPTKPNNSATWCVPKAGVADAELQANLDYACGQGIDCSSIQPGGACFEPNALVNHAAYAMNLLYQKSGRNPFSCDFSQTATLSTYNPSYNNCVYAGGAA
ncbi:glucan endo-1,3-beta-glucosidase 7-like isoform X2 [Lotus japonicus]|uniref:glucan endo-1,3-beta-glucosidase 7-like isoform X2 n=1 Tax=Lotus japonicus TaxID=34305 RepID=UPI0025865E79|nr:glucan endo-1,3-beta-glucosidase 7-like isoform X2 [Lotus japonicus]